MAGTNRLTGLMSGMDTESLINNLLEARKKKVDLAKKDQMNVKYKQDAWESLNTKLKSFQSSVSNLRFSSAYAKKTTSVSDSSVATVVTSDDAMLSNQTLKVNKMAKSAYLTGGEVKLESGLKATAATKLTELGAKVGDSININVGGKDTSISITAGMSLSDLANKLSAAGVNAKFDSASQRMFIGAKDTGAKADFNITGSLDSLKALGLDYDAAGNGSAKKIDGQDAEIELNGATFKSSNNTFNINGLTITANKETNGESVVLNTTKDTAAMYDTVKKLITEYTSLINEMDKMYNTKADKSYKPLTDEEKAEMSDYEIEKWEEKVKEQALSKDSNLYNISNTLNDVFMQGFKINGKTFHLSDFGIEAASYFESADNEKHALYIRGDKESSKYANETNKLEEMIASDPDSVASFFSQLSGKLYDSMNDMSGRVAGTRTFGNFFDDIKYKNDYTDYNSKISDLEQKLFDYEDKWYKKFAKMETAMAKMQSKTNALSSYMNY